MRFFISTMLVLWSQVGFSASDCTGVLSISTGALWANPISESYDVSADYSIIALSNIVLTVKDTARGKASAEFDFCEIFSLGSTSEYECTGFEAADYSRFPFAIRVKEVSTSGAKKFEFHGQSEMEEGLVRMDGSVTCAH